MAVTSGRGALWSALALSLTLSLTGCASVTASWSDEPVDTSHGSRTFGARIEDGSIERKVRINLLRDDPRFAEESSFDVVSFNGNVLLVGEVPDAQLKARASDIAGRVRHVRNVHNELQVGPRSSWVAGFNDGWLTTKTKSRLLIDGDAPGTRTKVVTANGVVYLMGLLTRAEADAAVEQVQRVYGVQKIVKIIEYIDQP
ncbi:lipoprotein [Isoalcanivorax pacificus W11-5]|uniref:Lipoprotein n=1 Tax=Isoalcanivorax pacificus W11-5 TaxID=391936 RepID=A0A0B4XJW3_9GAMM|nr:BON domain-containing protein [Isoalcanivorax pacificus]AJD47371.1 lipoprotein [Isoalcanivorax pacificus W11-5]